MSNFRVPYLVGNTKVRDHQYWTTITRAEFKAQMIAGGFDPAVAEEFAASYDDKVTDLAMIQQMSWRVREWTVSAGTFSYDGISLLLGSNHWIMNGSWASFICKTQRLDEFSSPRDVTDERDILGPMTDWPDSLPVFKGSKTLRNAGVFGSKVGSATVDENVGISGGPSPCPAAVQMYLLGGYVIYNTTTKQFYPFILMSGQGGFSGFGNAAVNFNITNAAGFNAGGHLTIVHPTGGTDIVLPFGIIGGHLPGQAEGTGTVSDVTMTATKWWPFKNSLGQPVYDETTGAQINDPFA